MCFLHLVQVIRGHAYQMIVRSDLLPEALESVNCLRIDHLHGGCQELLGDSLCHELHGRDKKIIKDNYIHLLKTSFFLAMVAILYLVYPL